MLILNMHITKTTRKKLIAIFIKYSPPTSLTFSMASLSCTGFIRKPKRNVIDEPHFIIVTRANLFKLITGDFGRIPDVGSTCLISSPANIDSNVVFPAPPRPIHITENSGRGTAGTLQHNVLKSWNISTHHL